MDFGELHSDYIRLGDLNKVVDQCRTMAFRLNIVVSWRIKKRTTTAFIKYNGTVLWQESYTNDMPHMLLLLMYKGIQKELIKRTTENNEVIARMRQAEMERLEEKKIMNMPSWQERRGKK